MYGKLKEQLQGTLAEIESNGLFKRERVITTPMDAVVRVNGKDVIIFCANNYLGLSSHPKVLEAAKNAIPVTPMAVTESAVPSTIESEPATEAVEPSI